MVCTFIFKRWGPGSYLEKGEIQEGSERSMDIFWLLFFSVREEGGKDREMEGAEALEVA